MVLVGWGWRRGRGLLDNATTNAAAKPNAGGEGKVIVLPVHLYR